MPAVPVWVVAYPNSIGGTGWALNVSVCRGVLLGQPAAGPAGGRQVVGHCREFFTTRFAQVRSTLDRAAKDRDEALAKLSQINARLGNLDTELSESKRKPIARKKLNRLVSKPKRTPMSSACAALLSAKSPRAKHAALTELRKFTAEQSVALAEQLIKRELTPEDDRRLVEAGAQFEKTGKDA